jgi:ParB-like chromosome segregation protein Spo0J
MTTHIGPTQALPIAQIKPNSQNSRAHSAKQIRQIANSITAFGFTNPLLVSEDGELIAGHGRYGAAKLLGLVEVPVIVIAGLSPARGRRTERDFPADRVPAPIHRKLIPW